MVAFIHQHAFILLCAYGLVWSVVFYRTQTERPAGWPFALYLFGLAGLFAAMAAAGVAAMARASGYAVAFAFIGHVVLFCFALLCNALPIIHTISFAVRMLGREAAGLDQMVFRKAYDRASGAETRGDFDGAARLYREGIEADPKDTEARRRLAEVLVRAGKPQEAVAELGVLLEMESKGEQACPLMFRLAEITDEQLHDRPGAVRLYQRIVREHPDSKMAGYASQRLRSEETTNAP